MTEPNNNDKLAPVRLVIDNAEEVSRPPEPPAEDPPPARASAAPNPKGSRKSTKSKDNAPKSSGRWDGMTRNTHGLPEGCPVVPLGIMGEVHYYLDDARQLRALDARGHSRLGIAALFGRRIATLYDLWPRLNQDMDAIGWKPEKAAEELMAAAARKGVWKASDRERGVGAWRGDDGELVLHCGDAIFQSRKPRGVWHEPGVIDRHVYPADEPIPQFHDKPAAAGDGGPAHKLLEILNTWAWKRGDVDAQLLLGWIAAAMIGGALHWRPLCWLTGGAGTGKSTLQELLKLVFDGALISVSDASAAGVWQKLGRRTLPVAMDELEPDTDNRKQTAVIKLARQAASGGLVLRGGADHEGTEFVIRSCFLFSSILIPPLGGQDRSRMAILELEKLREGSTPPDLEPDAMRELGLLLRRRLVDGWTRLEATIERYREELIAVGHSARGADQFGTLLACADVVLYDGETDTDTAHDLAEKLKASGLAEVADNASDEERCASHLLSTVIDPFRNGQRHTIAEWICHAADIPLREGSGLAPDPREANRVLGSYGLKVLADGRSVGLAIANYHQELGALYRGTHWAGQSGTLGGWVQAWRRLPGAETPNQTLYFAGHYAKGTVVPLEALPLPVAAARTAAPAPAPAP